ncbi:MAG: DUF6526 family protein [Ferruginibacter sp.]
MKNQKFKKHSRYVPGFHFLTSRMIIASAVVAIILLRHDGFYHTTFFDLLASLSLGSLFFYTRQFATGYQDRIIRAGENFRSYRLTGKELDQRFTKNQIVALRFTHDEEYADLIQKTIKENLHPKDIKQAIKQCRADYHRIWLRCAEMPKELKLVPIAKSFDG